MAPSVQLKFDPLAFLEQGRTTSGPYPGGYLVAPGGELNWYFANLGLLGFVPRIKSEVAAYIDLYLSKLTDQVTIQDVTFAADGTPTVHESDSDDSYAATFLSLVAAYLKASGDKNWFRARLPTFLMIAERNFIQNRYANGLTYPFQTREQYDLAYLQDNCEVYRGLADLIGALNVVGSAAIAGHYAAPLAATLRGITSLYNTRAKAWWWDYFPNGTHDPVTDTFYPDLVSQVFPQAYGVPVSVTALSAGYAYLNRNAPGWPEGQCQNMPGGKCDPFPWAMLGYVAALRKQTDAATRQVVHINSVSQEAGQRGALTINELGWYQRTLVLLGLAP